MLAQRASKHERGALMLGVALAPRGRGDGAADSVNKLGSES